jgi:hypothetical protein
MRSQTLWRRYAAPGQGTTARPGTRNASTQGGREWFYLDQATGKQYVLDDQGEPSTHTAREVLSRAVCVGRGQGRWFA